MQSIWKEARDSLAKLQRKSIRMQRKLFLYWLSMLLVVLSIFLVALHIAGVFSALDQEVNQLLLARQKSVITDLSYQLGKITAQGISVSEQATASLSNALFTDPVASLNDQPERIEELESLLYGPLTTALRSTPCSGAYLVLDATTNTHAPGAQTSRAGLYLRLVPRTRTSFFTAAWQRWPVTTSWNCIIAGNWSLIFPICRGMMPCWIARRGDWRKARYGHSGSA